MTHKTFEEVIEFDKNLTKEEGCHYIYTCPSLPEDFYIEFIYYGDAIQVDYWEKRDNGFSYRNRKTSFINVNVVLDKEWEGIKISSKKE